MTLSYKRIDISASGAGGNAGGTLSVGIGTGKLLAIGVSYNNQPNNCSVLIEHIPQWNPQATTQIALISGNTDFPWRQVRDHLYDNTMTLLPVTDSPSWDYFVLSNMVRVTLSNGNPGAAIAVYLMIEA